MRYNIFKILILFSLFSLSLVACSSNTPPTLNKLSSNIRLIEPNNSLSVFAQNNYPAPVNGQTITQTSRFKVVYDLYENNENKVLIPSDTIIAGTYVNDGSTCQIHWLTAYAYGDENMEKQNAVSIKHIALPTTCNPATGIKYGDQLVINFTSSNE